MGKLNLSEAAKEILNKSVASAGSEPFGLGKKLVADEQGEVNVGNAPSKTSDGNPDYTKGVPTATPPGAKPPVGSEKAGKLASQPGEAMGRKDLVSSSETDQEEAESLENIKNRVSSKKAKKTMQANKGAECCAEGEEEEDFEYEEEEEDFEEASVEEVMEDLEQLSESEFENKYGMSKEDALQTIEEAKEEDEKDEKDEEEDEEDEGEDEEEMYSSKKDAKKEHKMCKEDLDALFSGEALSEDFKSKAATIFETAVESRVEEIASELQESYLVEFENAVEAVKEDFADKLDSYLDYVVENWMEENRLAVEKGLRTEIAEDFINALKGVFVEHYIDIPDEKVNLVEELVAKVDTLEEQVNSQIQKNISLKKSLGEHKKNEVIHNICEGLTLSQVEKIKSLAKNIDFTTEEDFTEKLETLKESYFPSNIRPATQESLDETLALNEDENVSTKYVDPFIAQVAKTISKTVAK